MAVAMAVATLPPFGVHDMTRLKFGDWSDKSGGTIINSTHPRYSAAGNKISNEGALMEFVDNSRARGKEWNARIVTIAFEPDDERTLVFQDDGVGITPNVHRALFDLGCGSFQEDAWASKYSRHGTGIKEAAAQLTGGDGGFFASFSCTFEKGARCCSLLVQSVAFNVLAGLGVVEHLLLPPDFGDHFTRETLKAAYDAMGEGEWGHVEPKLTKLIGELRAPSDVALPPPPFATLAKVEELFARIPATGTLTVLRLRDEIVRKKQIVPAGDDILIKDAAGLSVSLSERIGKYYMDRDVAMKLMSDGGSFFEGFTSFAVTVGRTPVRWARETRKPKYDGKVFTTFDHDGTPALSFTLYEYAKGSGTVGQAGLILSYNDRKLDVLPRKPFATFMMGDLLKKIDNQVIGHIKTSKVCEDIIEMLGGEDDAWVVDDDTHDKVTAKVIWDIASKLQEVEKPLSSMKMTWKTSMRCIAGEFDANVCILTRKAGLLNDAKTAVCTDQVADLFRPFYRQVVSTEIASMRARALQPTTTAAATAEAAAAAAAAAPEPAASGGSKRTAVAGSVTCSAVSALRKFAAQGDEAGSGRKATASHKRQAGGVARGAASKSRRRATSRRDDSAEEEEEEEEPDPEEARNRAKFHDRLEQLATAMRASVPHDATLIHIATEVDALRAGLV